MSLVVRIIAPIGRDAGLLCRTLEANGVDAAVSWNFRELLDIAEDHPIGPLLIAEEALTMELVELLRRFLQTQPPWSSLPILIVLRANPGERTAEAKRRQILSFGLPVYLERPLRIETLISCVEAAVRARQRQYENRDALLERDRAMAELHQEREVLIRSEKLAAVGRLAASISHEINNPLEAVTNLLYLAAHTEELPPQVKQLLDTADDELRRVSQIVAHTLRFHRQSTNPRPIRAEELIAPTLGIYRGRLANSSIHVREEYRTSDPVTCMEGDIRQVLNNLIGNAIDAMRSGGTLRIRTSPSTRNGAPALRISVSDTGYGIPSEARARLFEPFFTTKGINGTGLGLWISQGIVQKHGGVLQVRSRTDEGRRGTVFSLLLPLHPELGET